MPFAPQIVRRVYRGFVTFLQMEGSARLELLEALLLPPVIWIGFRTINVSRTQGAVRRWAARGVARTEEPESTIARIYQTQQRVRYVSGIGGSCLVRSMTLWAMLLRRGVTAELRVGMRKKDGKIEGHAWLEYAGRIVNEAEDVAATYSAMPEAAAFDLWR